MKTYAITIESIKNLKKAIDFADNFRENNTEIDGYGLSLKNDELANSYDEKANNEVKLIASILNLDFNTVLDMAFDFEFAKQILN